MEQYGARFLRGIFLMSLTKPLRLPLNISYFLLRNYLHYGFFLQCIDMKNIERCNNCKDL